MTPEHALRIIDAWRDVARRPQGNMSRSELRPAPGALRDLLQALATSTTDPAWCGDLIATYNAVPDEARPLARARIRELIERLDKETEHEAAS